MQGGAARYDERVLPDSKAGASARQREQREAEERGRREERERERRDRQRTRQQHGLRHIWNTLLRPNASDTSSATTENVPGVPPGTPTSDDGNSTDYVVCPLGMPAAARIVVGHSALSCMGIFRLGTSDQGLRHVCCEESRKQESLL